VPSPSPCTGCEAPTTNTEPAVRLTVRLYTVEDGLGNFVNHPDPDQPIPILWYARIDATAKDQRNKDTNGEGSVRFFFEPDDVIDVSGNHTHQRRVRGLQTSDVQVWATLDGVRSNVVTLKFRPI
jgi:hypothetical protein